MTDDSQSTTLSSASAVVTAIEDVVRVMRFAAEQCGDFPAVSHMAAGRPWREAPLPSRLQLPDAERSHIVQTSAVGMRWRRESQVACLMDPTLAEECARATAEAMPTEILRQLRYRDPLIVFAAPIPCRTADDRPARLLGFFLYGLTDMHGNDACILSTHDDPDYLGVMPVLDTLDDSGHGPEVNRFLLSLRADRLVISEYIDNTVANYALDAFTAADASQRSVRACLEQILRPVLGSLLYLCSKDADIEDPRADGDAARNRGGRSGKAGRKRKDSVFVPVGWRLGRRLRRLRAAEVDQHSPTAAGSGTGRTHPPRQRACHFKVVWTKAGRTVPRTVFVLPYWIHKDQLGLDTTLSTLVPTSSRRRRRRRDKRTR